MSTLQYKPVGYIPLPLYGDIYRGGTGVEGGKGSTSGQENVTPAWLVAGATAKFRTLKNTSISCI